MRPLLDIRVARGGMFGGGGSSAPAPQSTYIMPPAPGTLQQTIISGAPSGPGPAGETDEQRRRRLSQFQIVGDTLGGGASGADAGGDGSGAAGGGAGTGADGGAGGGGGTGP